MFQNPSTVNALEEMTDFVAFEKLCCDLLASYGEYQGIVPQGVGRIDGGKDATLVRRDPVDVTVVKQNVVFHFSLRKDWKEKLWEDLSTTKKRSIPADHIVFLSSREVTPYVRDRLKNDAKTEYGWSLEILDQQWLRIPLDGEFQRLRKQYFGIDYDPRVFHDLESLLDRPERHPNRNDLEQGAYYRNDELHDRIHGLLDTQRHCLVLGKPGHGKTALAKGVGWELLSREARHAVFFIHAGMGLGYERWLHHITTFDHDWVTFILDDCHRAPEQVRALLDAWSDVRKARLVLISRPLDTDDTGPDKDNFQETLESVRVDIENDEVTVVRIIESIIQREHITLRDPGPLNEVIPRCGGDLHIIEFLARAWQKQPPDIGLGMVPEDAILDDVYARYLGGPRQTNRQHIAAIAALSTFEIPIESRWLGSDTVVAALRTDAFVACFVEEIDGIPTEFLRYFHSTPASYVIKAAHRKGILGKLSPNDFLLDRATAYVCSGPANLFEVFAQLDRNNQDDFLAKLFTNHAVMEAVISFIRSASHLPSEIWLDGFMILIYKIRLWEGDNGPVVRRVLDAFARRFPAETRGALWTSINVGAVRRFVRRMLRPDLRFANEVLAGIDYEQLGQRSIDLSITAVNTFIERIRQAGISNENLSALYNGIDFKSFGARASNSSAASIVKFILNADRARVSAENFADFFCSLDWQNVGRDVGPTIDESTPLWIFHIVNSKPAITKDMAQKFVLGMGWDAVRLVLIAPSGPDVIAALRKLLVVKCGYDSTTLKQYEITFSPKIWLRSFVERGCSGTMRGQVSIRRSYLQLALNGLKGYPSRPLTERLRGQRLRLQNWNILLHNLELADPQLLRAEIEPLLRDMSPTAWTRLTREANLLNLGLFARRFAADGGIFSWRPHIDSTLGKPDFDAILDSALLLEIAHPLFTLRYLGKSDWCTALAVAIDQDPARMLAKIEESDLKSLEFFLWNLLTSMQGLHCPAFLNSSEIGPAIIKVAKKHSKEQVDLMALCGTLHLWDWNGLSELTPLVNRESALVHCLEAAEQKNLKLIRLVVGLAALAFHELPAKGRQTIREGLDSLVFPFAVSNQILALKQSRTLIEAMGEI